MMRRRAQKPQGTSTCLEQTGDPALIGSTTQFKTLDFSRDQQNDQSCVWTVTCPAGSSVGYKAVTAFMYKATLGIFANDGSNAAPLATTTGPWWSGHFDPQRALLTETSIRIEFNTSWTGSGLAPGFTMDNMCFTDTCPSELVTTRVTETEQQSSVEIFGDSAGVTCHRSLSCANPADQLVVSMTGAVTLTADNTPATVNLAGSSQTVVHQPGATHNVGVVSLGEFSVQAACQPTAPVGGALCPFVVRTTSVLTAVEGEVSSDTDGSNLFGNAAIHCDTACVYNIECAGAMSITLKAQVRYGTVGHFTVRSPTATGESYSWYGQHSSPFSVVGPSAILSFESTNKTLEGAYASWVCNYAATTVAGQGSSGSSASTSVAGTTAQAHQGGSATTGLPPAAGTTAPTTTTGAAKQTVQAHSATTTTDMTPVPTQLVTSAAGTDIHGGVPLTASPTTSSSSTTSAPVTPTASNGGQEGGRGYWDQSPGTTRKDIVWGSSVVFLLLAIGFLVCCFCRRQKDNKRKREHERYVAHLQHQIDVLTQQQAPPPQDGVAVVTGEPFEMETRAPPAIHVTGDNNQVTTVLPSSAKMP